MKPSARAPSRAFIGLLGLVLLTFLVLPLVALFFRLSLADFSAGLAHPLVWPALQLSALTTCVSSSVVLLLGTPLAWLLARSRGKLGRAVELVVQLPIVIPPAVAGIALLLAFGNRGLFAGWLYPAQSSIPFSTLAVVFAEVFVAAPFFLQGAISAFRRIDDDLLLVARTLGASPGRILMRVAIPIAAPGLAAAATMSWARALGEFGATLMFAGNLTGKTQTLPLAIYTAMESDLRAAQALSVILVLVAAAMLFAARSLTRAAAPRESFE